MRIIAYDPHYFFVKSSLVSYGDKRGGQHKKMGVKKLLCQFTLHSKNFLHGLALWQGDRTREGVPQYLRVPADTFAWPHFAARRS